MTKDWLKLRAPSSVHHAAHAAWLHRPTGNKAALFQFNAGPPGTGYFFFQWCIIGDGCFAPIGEPGEGLSLPQAEGLIHCLEHGRLE